MREKLNVKDLTVVAGAASTGGRGLNVLEVELRSYCELIPYCLTYHTG